MLYIANKKSVEHYSRVFPPLNTVFYIKYRRVITPLRPLKSPLQLLQYDAPLPPLFCYIPAELSPVLNQGRCGACYGFVISSLMSDITSILTGGKFKHPLNVSQILNCFNNTDPCGGEVPEDVMLWLARSKIPVGVGNGIYSGIKGKCETPNIGIQITNVHSLVQYVDEENIQNATIDKNVINLKRQLLLNGPFFATISIYKDLFEYVGNEVYTRKSDELMGGHAIEIVGYVDANVDTRPGFTAPYWVVKNCWGGNFPTNGDIGGYFFIRMGTNECGIESRCGKIEVNVAPIGRTSLAVDDYGAYKRRVLRL